MTHPGILQVREVAERFGQLLHKPVSFTGKESSNAYLNNPGKLCAELGEPGTPLDQVMVWTAHWVKQGGRSLNRPTHFEVRSGQY